MKSVWLILRDHQFKTHIILWNDFKGIKLPARKQNPFKWHHAALVVCSGNDGALVVVIVHLILKTNSKTFVFLMTKILLMFCLYDGHWPIYDCHTVVVSITVRNYLILTKLVHLTSVICVRRLNQSQQWLHGLWWRLNKQRSYYSASPVAS